MHRSHELMKLLLATALGVMMTGAAFCASRDIAVERVEGARGDKYALIVGINNFDDPGIADLEYAVSDAEGIHAVLTDADVGAFGAARVRLLTDNSPAEDQPTRTNILEALRIFTANAQASDTVFFYFGGHGIEDYLVPRDARLSLLEDTAISVARVNEMFKECRAQRHVVIYDCCHSGGARTGSRDAGRMSRDLQNRMFEAEGRVTLSSCSRDEVAYEWPEKNHGVFTWFLMEALRGGGDENKDGVVTATEAAYHVMRGVKNWAIAERKVQTPRLNADISGPIVLSVAAAEAPADGRWLVRVKGTQGARVYVNGKQRGTIPCEVDLTPAAKRDVTVTEASPEEVELRAELEGFRGASRRVALGKETVVEFELSREAVEAPSLLLLVYGEDSEVEARTDEKLREELRKLGVELIDFPGGFTRPAKPSDDEALAKLRDAAGAAVVCAGEMKLTVMSSPEGKHKAHALLSWEAFWPTGRSASGTGSGNSSSTQSRDRALRGAMDCAIGSGASSILKGLTRTN